MRSSSSKRIGLIGRGQRRGMILAAACTLSMTSMAHATTVYFDANGDSDGFGSGTATWDESTTAAWDTAPNTSATAGTNLPGVWNAATDYNTAEFQAAFTANVSGTVNLGGIIYNSGATVIGGTGAAGTYDLNIGSNNISISHASGVTAKEIIYAPITGSGNITWSMVSGGTMDFSGDMSQFTGGITVNNGGTRTTGGTTASLNFAYTLGNSSAPVNVDANIAVGMDNFGTNNGITTPTITTVNNPITLNYGGTSGTPVATANNFLYGSNGINSMDYDSANGLYDKSSNNAVMGVNGQPNTETTTDPDNNQITVQTTMAGTQKMINFAGVISSPSSATTNVYIGTGTGSGGRGTVVLSNHNTWNGNTTITMTGSTGTSGNGLVQLGIDDALPTATNLIFGTSNNVVAPLDLNGHSMQVGALNTGTGDTTAVANGVSNGNIYNISPAGSSANAATITIAGSTTSIYKGDIGDTNLNVHPFDNMIPYIKSDSSGWAIQANTNISLKLNGSGVVALAPVANQPNGNEYSGSTTVNGGTLVLARTGTFTGGPGVGIPGGNYTITGGGDLNVNSGATLASLSTNATTYAGANAGTINLNSGAQLIPGEAKSNNTLSTDNIGTLSADSVNFNSGASMTFSIASTTSYDYLFYNGSFNLDSSSPTHTINIALASGKTLFPGVYTLINGFGISGDGTNADGTSSGFALGTIPSGYNGFSFKLFDNGAALQLQVAAPTLQWDPSGQGLATTTGTIQEGSGEWTDGTGSDGVQASSFYDYSTSQDVPWTNNANKQVYVGNDVNQNGGTITLGSNISLADGLTFGNIAAGNNYKIVDGATSYTLTLGGGITVLNAASSSALPTTSSTPSAEIDTPIVLSADQKWDVPAGQYLDVKGTVTGNFALTQADSGAIYFESPVAGSVGSVNLQGGTMLLASTNELGASMPITINGGSLEYTSSGTVTDPLTFGTSGGSIGAYQISGSSNAVSITLPAITTTNAVTIVGNGTVTLATSNSFGSLGIAGGTVPVSAASQLGSGNPLVMSGGTLALTGVASLTNTVGTGSSAAGEGTISDTVPVTFNVGGTGASALDLSGTEFTLNVLSNAAVGAIIGETDSMIIHKTGAGTLTAGGYTGTTASGAGASLVVDQGAVSLGSVNGLGGGSNLSITVNAGAELDFAWTSGTARTGGSVTVNSGSVVRLNNLSTGNSETSVTATAGAAGAADVWTFSGNSKVQNATIVPGNVNQIMGFTNPIVITTGSTLTAEIDNTNGFGGNNGINFRGPTGSTNMYDTFTLQAGATLIQTGPGQLRFGRVASQGVPIIGQGTPDAGLPNGGDALLQLGPDCYMEDKIGNNVLVITEFLPNGTGNAGLRVETAMNATYNTIGGGSNPGSIGTTGLFGVDPYAGQTNHTSGNVYTVFAPDRAAALSSTYNNGTTTITPSGTLTLAANDAGGASGVVDAGPGAACAVWLALDNTASSGGTLTYQIDPGGNSATFKNFAGLTLERTYSTAGVTGQLLGTTLIPAVTISGGATLDITNQALAVDPGAGGTPALATIAGYLATGYDQGKWDGAGGINSSMIASLPGVSIGYALNSALPADQQFTNFGGQSISLNAVLVKYTWDGDLNLDGVVDAKDAALMADGNPGWMGGDLNYDGVVNADDWSLFMKGAAFQTGQLNSAVPEPSALGLIAGAGLLMRRRRRG